MSDETAVREMLHDLTFDQPVAPVDRVAGVRRHHARRRIAVTSGAAFAAAAASITGLLTANAIENAQRAIFANPTAASWQLNWPLRPSSMSTREVVAATHDRRSAVAYYQRASSTTLRDVRTLFVGTPDNSGLRWLVVEADVQGASGDAIHELLAFSAAVGTDSWTAYSDAAPPTDVAAIGLARTSPQGTSLVILASPGRRLANFGHLVPGAGVAYGHWVTLHDGIGTARFAGRAMPGDVFVSATDSGSTYPVTFPEATPGANLPRHWQKALDSPGSGVRTLTFEAGAGGGDVATIRVPKNGTITVSIVCVGPAPVHLTVVDGSRQASTSQPECRGQNSPVEGDEILLVHRGDRIRVTTDASQFTRFAAAVYLVS